MQLLRSLALPILVGALATPGQAQTVVRPGSPRIDPRRVHLGRDSIIVLSVDTAGHTHLVATLVRQTVRLAGPGGGTFREMQHYVYGGGQYEFDTLDVAARTLQVKHIAEIGPHTRNVLDARGQRLVGMVSPTDTSASPVNIDAPAAFHDMMLEAFIGALPIAPNTTLSIPTLRPPALDIRTITIDVQPRVDSLDTANGRVECYVITRRGHDVTTWVARSDGHIVRLRWTSPDGSTIWKLPAADVTYVKEIRP